MEEVKFAYDSPLEERGFELSVPPRMETSNGPSQPHEHPRKTGAADPRKGPGSSGLFHQLSFIQHHVEDHHF
jgi:hypothetical protein